jgi:hypothetical protein
MAATRNTITRVLRTFRVVDLDGSHMRIFIEDDAEALQQCLSRRELSPWDRHIDGNSLMQV